MLLTGPAGSPSWSARGVIAFVRRGLLWSVRADGGGLRTLRAPRDTTQVRWSPDGSKLVVEQFEIGISIANADGRGGLRMIVQDQVGATHDYATRGVAWQPLR